MSIPSALSSLLPEPPPVFTGVCLAGRCAALPEPAEAEEILQSGKADLVGLVRHMVYNPRWPWHAAAEMGVHLDYQKRYHTAHSSFGSTLKFAESKEKTKAIERMNRLAEEAKAALER